MSPPSRRALLGLFILVVLVYIGASLLRLIEWSARLGYTIRHGSDRGFAKAWREQPYRQHRRPASWSPPL